MPYDDVPAAHAELTPDTPTIDTLVAHLDRAFPRADRPWTAADTLKNVVFTVRHPDGTTEALAIGLPGDREVDTKRLESKLGEGVVFEPFGEADFAARPSLAKGYIGPASLGEKKDAESGSSSTPASSRARAGSPGRTSAAATC